METIDATPPAPAEPSAAARARAAPWLPIIPPRRRRTLWQIHQQLAAEWSQHLREYLRHGEQFSFGGFGFETFGQLAASGETNASMFTCGSGQVSGLMLANAEMTRYLVQTRLGGAPARAARVRRSGTAPELADAAPAESANGAGGNPADSSTGFTQLETVVLGKAIDALLQELGALYAAAGAGSLKVTRRGEQLQNVILFTPETYLMVFRYRIGDAESPSAMTVAVGIELINLLKDPESGKNLPSSEQVRLAVTGAPLEVQVVLGNWNATLAELASLKPGDEIVLPDGTDAWLSVAGIRIKRVRAKMTERKIVLESGVAGDGRD